MTLWQSTFVDQRKNLKATGKGKGIKDMRIYIYMYKDVTEKEKWLCEIDNAFSQEDKIG